MCGRFGMDPASLKDVPYQSKATDDFCGSIKGRQETDRHFKLVLQGAIISLIVLVIYCAWNGDIDREFQGYDNCGHVCGKKNDGKGDLDSQCTEGDMTDKPLLQLNSFGNSMEKITERSCVVECSPGYFKLIDVCLPGRSRGSISATDVQVALEEIYEDFALVKDEIFQLILLALTLSLVMIGLLRHYAGFLVWLLLIAPSLVLVVIALTLWAVYMEDSDSNYPETPASQAETEVVLAAAIGMTIVSFVIIAMILIMRKRIKLVIRLFKEAGKAIEAMPFLLVQPLFTFVSLVLLGAVMIVSCVLISSGGILTKNPITGDIFYKKNLVMRFADWFALFMWLWLTQFCIGCQHMIIAGSAASWFFTRDKSQLRSPIWNASRNLFTYHLGTVALGSLILTVVQIIRSLLSAAKNHMKKSRNPLVRLVYYVLASVFNLFTIAESLITFWTRNAYIQVAMFGTNFCEGGKQAFHVLISNAFRVAALNSVGDFVLFLAKVLVVGCTTGTGLYMLQDIHGLHSKFVPLLIVFGVSFFIIHCFLAVYEMVIDTIFMCFCEDCEINDGVTRPYFMNKGLMEFVEYSNQKYLAPRGVPNPSA